MVINMFLLCSVQPSIRLLNRLELVAQPLGTGCSTAWNWLLNRLELVAQPLGTGCSTAWNWLASHIKK